MGAFVVAISLCLLLSSVSRAVPIIGGEFTQTLTSTHVQLVGPWFDIGFGAGVPALGSYSAYLDCESGCREGDVVDLFGDDGGDNLTFATGEVRGVFYPALNLGRDDIQTVYTTFFNISAGAITVDGSLLYQRSFTFSGRLVAFTPGAV